MTNVIAFLEQPSSEILPEKVQKELAQYMIKNRKCLRLVFRAFAVDFQVFYSHFLQNAQGHNAPSGH